LKSTRTCATSAAACRQTRTKSIDVGGEPTRVRDAKVVPRRVTCHTRTTDKAERVSHGKHLEHAQRHRSEPCRSMRDARPLFVDSRETRNNQWWPTVREHQLAAVRRVAHRCCPCEAMIRPANVLGVHQSSGGIERAEHRRWPDPTRVHDEQPHATRVIDSFVAQQKFVVEPVTGIESNSSRRNKQRLRWGR
jgi:hypothetical protein